MGFMMELLELFPAYDARILEYYDGVEFNPGDDQFSIPVFFQVAHGVIRIVLDYDSFECADGEEGEHVTAGKGSDVGGLGVDLIGIPEELCGRGGRQSMAVFKTPFMVARVGFVGELCLAPLPGQPGFVLRHGFVLRKWYFVLRLELVLPFQQHGEAGSWGDFEGQLHHTLEIILAYLGGGGFPGSEGVADGTDGEGLHIEFGSKGVEGGGFHFHG